MEFKIELKTHDGKPVPPDAKFEPQQDACRIVAEAVLRQRSGEKANPPQKEER